MSPVYNPQKSLELINRITGGGLAAVYKFTRTVSIFSRRMVSVDISFTNSSDQIIQHIKIGDKVRNDWMFYWMACSVS